MAFRPIKEKIESRFGGEAKLRMAVSKAVIHETHYNHKSKIKLQNLLNIITLAFYEFILCSCIMFVLKLLRVISRTK